MALNILGGIGKGQILKVPPGDMIRPMSVLLKRKIFDSRQNLEGHVFVDLCAGSGAVGLEAWSRGANQVYFCEISKKVYSFTRENINKIKTSYDIPQDQLKLFQKDCSSWLKNDFEVIYQGNSTTEWILFFAPPYPDHKIYEKVLNWLNQQSWYEGEIWVESCNDKGIKEARVIELLSNKTQIKHVKQGSSFLKLFKTGP